MAKEAIDTVSQEYEEGKYFQNHRTKYCVTRMKRVLQQSMEGIWHQMQQGEFFQYFSEKKFPDKDKMESTHLDLGGGREIVLHGQIDRVDVCEEEDKVYVKVIDYKSGNRDFSLAALYYGLQLQLVVYMNAAVEMEEKDYPDRKVVPAAMLYYRVHDPLVEGEETDTPEQIQEKILAGLRMTGVVNADEKIVESLDREFGTKSDVIPVERKKDGSFRFLSGPRGPLKSAAILPPTRAALPCFVTGICGIFAWVSKWCFPMGGSGLRSAACVKTTRATI